MFVMVCGLVQTAAQVFLRAEGKSTYLPLEPQPVNASLNATNPTMSMTSQNTEFFVSILKISEFSDNVEIRSTIVQSIVFTRAEGVGLGGLPVSNYTVALENGAIISTTVSILCSRLPFLFFLLSAFEYTRYTNSTRQPCLNLLILP